MGRCTFKLLTILMFLVVSQVALAQNTINSVRVWPSPDNTRVVFDLDDKPDFSYFMLKNPSRLVIDLKDTDKLKTLPSIPKEHQIVSKLRYSKPKDAKRRSLDVGSSSFSTRDGWRLRIHPEKIR